MDVKLKVAYQNRYLPTYLAVIHWLERPLGEE